MSATTPPPTERTRVRRLAKRGQYDLETIYAILDEALIGHVGFVVDGLPVVIPTIQWREGSTLYVHGSAASRMLRSLKDGVDACVTVTLLDGLVLARSAFHHSMNYRSVVVFGKAREVTGDEKLRALESLVEHVVRGRGAEVRGPNEIGAAPDARPRAAHRGGLGQDPHRSPGRRGGGLRAAGLGRGAAADAHTGSAGAGRGDHGRSARVFEGLREG